MQSTHGAVRIRFLRIQPTAQHKNQKPKPKPHTHIYIFRFIWSGWWNCRVVQATKVLRVDKQSWACPRNILLGKIVDAKANHLCKKTKKTYHKPVHEWTLERTPSWSKSPFLSRGHMQHVKVSTVPLISIQCVLLFWGIACICFVNFGVKLN